MTKLIVALGFLALNAYTYHWMARDAMTDGGKLTVIIDETPERITIHIQDTGSGVDEATLQHAFEPFFSTKLDPQTDIPRVGLGLAVVHGIVADMGGHIAIRPCPTKGTDVEIVLPQSDDQDSSP